MVLAYWFMLPVSVGVATVAMASGVEGATFFAPIFLLALGLPPDVAIGTGLLTEVFGFASGVTAYVRRGLIDYRLARSLLMATVPLAVLGSLVAGFIRPEILETILGVGLFAVAVTFLRAPDHDDRELLDHAIEEEQAGKAPSSSVTTADGETISYTVCNRAEGMAISGIGALFMGMISTGLGEMNGYFLLQRCKVPSRVAVATSVLVVAVTALSAASIHMFRFVQAGGETLSTVLSLAVFTVPGVLVGGQLGPALTNRISQKTLERSLGILFAIIGAVMLAKVAL